jgi:hypothetical protein
MQKELNIGFILLMIDMFPSTTSIDDRLILQSDIKSVQTR